MSLEMPRCSSGDCWYSGNTDRINGSGSSFELVISTRENSFRGYDIEPDYRPETLWLCDVCYYNDDTGLNSKCSLCQTLMFDSWIKIDEAHYCRYCISGTEMTDYLEEQDIISVKTFINEERFARATRIPLEERNKNDLLIIDYLRFIITRVKEDKKKKKETRKRKREEYEERTRNKIARLLPTINEKTSKMITDKVMRLYTEGDYIADYDSLDDFLQSLL